MKTFANTRYAVAGASGFLGRRLIELLQLQGTHVRALVRKSSQIKTSEQLPVFALNFDDTIALKAALQGTTTLFNCIGHSSDWGPWSEFLDGNVHTIGHLLRAAAESGVRRIIHVSTTDVYGYPRAACDEKHPLTDIGLPYNRSKILGELIVNQLARELGLAVTIVRPATIFGPSSHDWVVELSHALRKRKVPTIRGGSSHAGLVFVDDVAYSMINLAEKKETIGQAYNIVDPQPICWLDYFNALCAAMNIRGPRINIPSPLAFAIARASEATAHLLRSARRPLMTRHVVFVMSRDQHYLINKLRQTLPEYPFIGLQQGISLTKQWIINHFRP